MEGRTQADSARSYGSSIKAEGWLRESDVKPQHGRHVAQVSLWICSSLGLGPLGTHAPSVLCPLVAEVLRNPDTAERCVSYGSVQKESQRTKTGGKWKISDNQSLPIVT